MFLRNKIVSKLHNFMILPAFILFFIFFIYPLIKGIGLSLTDYDGMTKANFIGLKNFVDFFHDSRAKNDVINTVLFALGSAPLLNIFGFLYALLLDSKFKGKSIARTIIYLPAVVSPLIMGYIWYFILQPQRGFLFSTLARLGLDLTNFNWLGNRYMALWVIIVVNVWQFVGMTMVVYLAGLQSIPEEMHEAGKIDGATYWQRIRYIVLPMMIQPIKINVTTNIIGSLSVFEIIMALTDGGPGYSTESLSIYIMRMCYGSSTGYSTAVAIILFLIILLPVLISLKLMKSKEYDV
ncbi:putative ABC transporter permease protein AmyD [Vallitalea longa]|uniref:ABC transporter permease protein AmyD n=1 Tax=Vallitalea longa TaxID=2936439 RepID=A0A9W6DF96_9FIRM|nr:sugar ABC transporter permease [Vallitalea longa]GKX30345.1 putative ABC transporter permease protein AmyD [Vallitalea longa]